MCDDLAASRWESEERYHVCKHGMRVDFHCLDCEREAAKLNIARLLQERNEARAEVERLRQQPHTHEGQSE